MMLKYGKIINKLTDPQKIRLLTDASVLATDEFVTMGIPKLNICDHERYSRAHYPSVFALANSWDRALVRSVAEDVLGEMSTDGIDLALTAGAKAKLDPHRAALSEDPFLSSALAGEYLMGAKNAGLSVCMTDYGISGDETEWLDREPDPRVISEFVVKPFADAVKKADCCAVMAKDDLRSVCYDELNHELAKTAAERASARFSICGKASAATTVTYLQNGVICLEASEVALDSAMRRYAQIKRAVEKGSATDADLDAEIVKGKAISPEKVNEALDRLIDLSYTCDEHNRINVFSSIDRETLTKNAAYSSAVLLQNRDGFLPLSNKGSVGIIGDIAFKGENEGDTAISRIERLLAVKGFNCVGSAKGYELSSNRSEGMLMSAQALAAKVNTVLLFLGFDEAKEKYISRERNSSLPANQCALAHSLRFAKKKTIAVVSANYAFDISAVEDFAAVLLLPMGLKHSPEALVDIITGAFNPCGRLSSTLYRNTEHSFEKQRMYLHRGMRAGPFVGYRYYDTAGYDVGYPFGHGLGYSEFAYSSARISGNKLTVNVKNIGKTAGETVVQIYAGKSGSAVIRPKKELIAFEKLRLQPKESKTLELELTLPAVYNTKNGKFETEAGGYIIYIGESVSDIRLSVKMNGQGVSLESDGAKKHQYLQSESNVISDNYTLEANYKLMKRSVKNIVCGSALMALALSVQVYSSMAGIYHLFLHLLSAALVIIGIIIFIYEAFERKKIENAEREMADRENQAMFSDAEQLEKLSTEQMFRDEFDIELDAVDEQKKEAESAYEGEYFNYVDKDFTLANAAEEFEIFAAEHGAKFDSETVRSIISAMASSRLILVNDMDESQFRAFTAILGEYFETTAGIDRAGAHYTSPESLLYTMEQNNWTKNKTAFHYTLDAANNSRPNIHIAAFTGVSVGMLSTCLGEIVRYAKNPTGYNYISSTNEQNVKVTHYIPQNVWVFINTDAAISLDSIPADISEAAAVCKIHFTSCEKIRNELEYHRLRYYQLDYLTARVTDKFEIAEDSWKKVDRLVSFVNKRAPFSIGNKQWIGMERYASSFTACGGDVADAMDRMLSARLVPSALSALGASEENVNLGEAVEDIFGEGNVEVSCKTVRESEKLKAQITQ